jgi:putative transposase
MKDDPQNHHRRSIRLKGYDYTQPGAYFVTICSYQREEVFGEVVEGEMRLNLLGEIVREEWLRTIEIRSNVRLHEDEFVIMPNHIHGILRIVEPVGATLGSVESSSVGATRRVAPTTGSRTLVSGSIGAILGQFKSITAKRINVRRGTPGISVWQRNYYEHIICNENELKKIWNYIDTNPSRWQEDQLHPPARPNPFNQDCP